MSDIAVAAVLAGVVLLASMVSVEAGLSVALIELVAGFVAGNALSLSVPSWLAFIGTFAGVVLVFLAGAEVDMPQFKREWRAPVSIGAVSFVAPFVTVGLLGYYALGTALEDGEEFANAANAYAEAARRSASDNQRGRAMLAQARSLLRAGQTSKAAEVYRAILLLPSADETVTEVANERLGEILATRQTP